MPHRITPPACAHRQHGLSLIELMISLVLGLVLVGGVLGLYLSSRETFRTHESLALIQENGRLALELITREIREAGAAPCGSPLTANLLVSVNATPTVWWANTAAGFLRGGEGVNNGQGVVNPNANTDSLMILRSESEETFITAVRDHNAAANRLTVPTSVSMREGDIALLCDGNSSALWQVGAVTGIAPNVQITYGASPLNCSTALGSVNGQCGAPQNKTFQPGALLTQWAPGLWFIQNINGQPALFRQDRFGAEEKVRGVENMQIDYLTRDQAGVLAIGWVNAANFEGNWANPASEVVAVRIALTLISDVTQAAGAGQVRRTFQSVTSVRNRLN